MPCLTLPNSVALVLGMTLAMSLLGVVAALAGRITSAGSLLGYAVAIVPWAMGMQVLGSVLGAGIPLWAPFPTRLDRLFRQLWKHRVCCEALRNGPDVDYG